MRRWPRPQGSRPRAQGAVSNFTSGAIIECLVNLERAGETQSLSEAESLLARLESELHTLESELREAVPAG